MGNAIGRMQCAMTVRTTMLKLLRDQRGATAVEYGLIVAVLVLGIMAGLEAFAGGAIGMWEYVSSTSTEAMENAQSG